MITGYKSTSDVQIRRVVYYSVSGSDALTTQELLSGSYLEATSEISIDVPTPSDTGSGTGFYHTKACSSRPGYGFDDGASRKCSRGFYNAGGNDWPCQE
jgi:hypothetical protein